VVIVFAEATKDLDEGVRTRIVAEKHLAPGGKPNWVLNPRAMDLLQAGFLEDDLIYAS